MFKGLLFLSAGAVVHSTRTRNMEEMGGLIRRMPSTALYFLIGAVAISGLPPLNGFVSEWLTYQALLAGFGSTAEPHPPDVPDCRLAARLTAALAAACFVKAFGIPFLALPRSDRIRRGAGGRRRRCGPAWASWPPLASCSDWARRGSFPYSIRSRYRRWAFASAPRWWPDGIALQAGSPRGGIGLHRRHRDSVAGARRARRDSLVGSPTAHASTSPTVPRGTAACPG